jgi:hypothetical protein
MRRRAFFYGGVLATAAALGCSKPGTAPTVPAQGTLLHNGQPAQAARIIFTPKSGRPATGNTDDEGHFVLSTFESEDGAVPGEHTVTVSDLKRNWNQDPSTSRFPSPYERPDTTPLIVEVKPEDENSFTFDMKN